MTDRRTPRDPDSGPPRGRGHRRLDPRLLPVAILGLAMLARLPSLGDGLWYDEIAAWTDYASRGPAHVLTTYDDPANHVLQSLLSWASFEAFGSLLGGELAMRLPSLLISLAAVALVAWLAGQGLRGRPEDAGAVRIAALLAAGCPVLALSGTEARGYAFMIAGAAGATAAWIAWMRRAAEPPDRRGPAAVPLAAYAAAMLLGAWAHPVTAVVAAGHALASIALAMTAAARRGAGGPGVVSATHATHATYATRAALSGLLPVAIAGVLTLAACAGVVGDMLALRGSLQRAGGGQPGLAGPEGLHAVLQMGGVWSPWAAPGLVLAAAGTIVLLARARRGDRDALLLLLGWGSGAAVAVAIVTLAGTWVYARFLLMLVPGSLVAMAAGLAWLLHRRPLVGRLALAAIIAGWAWDLADRGPRQPIREAAEVVLERAAPGEAVHAIGLKQQVSRAYLGSMPFSWSGDHGARLAEELPDPPPTWLVMLYPQRVDDSVRESLRQRGYGRIARFHGWIDWGGGDVEVWRR